MAKKKNKKNNNFVSENKIDETLDERIEQMEANGGMSEAAMEAEIAAQENPKPDYLDENGNPHWFDEEEDYDVGQIPLEVVDRTEMLYANSDKVAAREYKIRIDEGLFKELAPEQYSETSFSDDEIPAIAYRQSTDSEVPDQFLISKFKRGNYDIPLIQTTVEIKDEELLKQIKFNVENYEEKKQRKETEFSNSEENNAEKKEYNNSNLEQSSLDNAAELLKNIKFSPENYKKLLNVINEISEISGNKKIEIPKPEEISKTEKKKRNTNRKSQNKKNAPVEQKKRKKKIEMFDPAAPIVYGKTFLPSFAVKTEKGLVSIENPIVTGFNKKNGTYEVESGGEKFELPKKTFETLLSDKKEQEAVQARIAEGKTIVFADKKRGIKGTEIPEFSLITQHGLKTYKGFVPQSRDEAAGTYTLSNGEETLILKAKDFAEVTAPERWENKFDENSPAWQKLIQSQYDDYFKLRENTAANFTHNLSVACREKANSPCDAMRAAKMIIDQMSKDEKAKTQALLNEMAREEKNLNMVIAGIYHEAVKCVPLNEEKIKQDFPAKYIARPMFDTISGEGQKIENDQALVKNGQDRNLQIGSVLKNIDVQSDALFGKGKNSVRFSELRVVSASKEGNSITLMDEKNSYIKLPRDTVLSLYKEQQLREMKSERKVERKNTMSISYS